MSEECEKRCLEAPLFPREIANGPGLSRLVRRIGGYADVRAYLLRRLDEEPLLASWTHREPDDPGIAVLEGAATVADILTFYQDRYANEVYLRTATERESVRDLVRLLGYRLRPGLGGRATFALECRGKTAISIPRGFPFEARLSGRDKPTHFETVSDLTAYPALSRFRLYRPVERKRGVDLESHNEFFLRLADGGPCEGLEVGDTIAVWRDGKVGGYATMDNLHTAEVEEIAEYPGYRHFRLRGLCTDGAEKLRCGKVKRIFRHFGHNAPGRIFEPAPEGGTTFDTMFNRATRGDTVTTSEHLSTSSSTGAADGHSAGASDHSVVPPSSLSTDRPKKLVVAPKLAAAEVPLDSDPGDVFAGTKFLIRYDVDNRRMGLALRKVMDVQSSSVLWGSLSGPAAILAFDEHLEGWYTDIRYMILFELDGPILEILPPYGPASREQGRELLYEGAREDAEALEGRTVVVVRPGSEDRTMRIASVDVSVPVDADVPTLWRVSLNEDVAYDGFSHTGTAAEILGNVVDATEGKSHEDVVLGNGDARRVFQTFRIPKTPLTYHLNAENPEPVEPSLSVYVDDCRWERVASFYGRGPAERIYIVREDGDGESWVQFGDGKTGARLPSGVGNVVAHFRTGSGAIGQGEGDRPVRPMRTVQGLQAARLCGTVSGGEAPETGEHAVRAAPSTVRTLGRLVSADDYAARAMGIPGVAKADAVWTTGEAGTAGCGGAHLAVTILMENGRAREFRAVRTILRKLDSSCGPGRFPVTVVGCERLHARIEARLGIVASSDIDDVKRRAAAALGATVEGRDTARTEGLFGRDRGFGQDEPRSRITAVLQRVAGVVSVDILTLGYYRDSSGSASGGSSPALNTCPDGIPCTARQILSLAEEDLTLTTFAVEENIGAIP